MGQRKRLRTTTTGMWSNQKSEGTGARGRGGGEPARLIQRRFDLAESATRCQMLCVSCVDPLSGVFAFGARRLMASRHGRLPPVTLRPFGIFIRLLLDFDH